MLTFAFQTTKSLLVEAGSSRKIGALLSELGCRSVFIVTDKGVHDAGLLGPSLTGLKQHGIAVTLFLEVQADPSESVVERAVQLAVDAEADAVLGIGGGSAMDVAKLVAFLAANSAELDAMYGIELAKGPRLRLVLAPTTAGTGSEMTPISIVTTRSGEKKGVVSAILLPDWAVLDADLTLTLPRAVTAATGIDAMVHAVEAYTSKRLKNPISDALAKQALQLLSGSIRTVCQDGGDREAREKMLLGAALAGMAFANAPVAAVHALAYPIGARFHVPHGLSNAMVLPGVIAFNADHVPSLYADIADIVFPGIGATDQAKSTALAQGFSDLCAEIGLDVRLSAAGIQANNLPRLAADAMNQTRLLINNPRDVTYSDALSIYEDAL